VSLYAIKSVSSTYRSADLSKVSLGLNGPSLNPSLRLDYSIGNTVTAPAPGLFAYGAIAELTYWQDVWPARLGPAGRWDTRRAVELQFEEGDIISTRRHGRFVVEVRLSSAVVFREMASGLASVDDGYPAFRDQDPSLYIIPE
jgi:hypothetical protein